MEKLVTVKDIAERYSCTGKTARKYLRQMFHYENPLTAPRWAVDEWERSRAEDSAIRIRMNKDAGRTIVPRRRANNG